MHISNQNNPLFLPVSSSQHRVLQLWRVEPREQQLPPGVRRLRAAEVEWQRPQRGAARREEAVVGHQLARGVRAR